jgi:hypothetical protein
MSDKLSLSDYDKFRKLENASVEIKENEDNENKEQYNLWVNTIKKTPSNKNIFNDIHNLIYEENQNEKIFRLSYSLTLQELKQLSLKNLNNKLKFELVLKDILLKKNSSNKDYVNSKLKLYHTGYIVWKSLLGERYEDLTLIE